MWLRCNATSISSSPLPSQYIPGFFCTSYSSAKVAIEDPKYNTFFCEPKICFRWEWRLSQKHLWPRPLLEYSPVTEVVDGTIGCCGKRTTRERMRASDLSSCNWYVLVQNLVLTPVDERYRAAVVAAVPQAFACIDYLPIKPIVFKYRVHFRQYGTTKFWTEEANSFGGTKSEIFS